MSSAKFEAVSASLLARKGDAAPSLVLPVMASPRPALVPRHDRRVPKLPPFPSEPRQPDNAEKLRRIVLSVTHEDLERLSIAAIKTGATRHDIVRSALHDYFRKVSADLPHPCACMDVESCSCGPAR